MIGLLLAMYPARWRQRYGEEFRAILESRPLGPFDFADVLIVDEPRRLPDSPGAAAIDGGPLMMLRLGGYGALFGGALWFAGLAVASRPGGEDTVWLGLVALGTLGLLAALIGLSAFQAHSHPILAWAAFAIPGLGALVSMIGATVMAFGPGDDPMVLGSLSAWSVWAIGLFGTFIGSIIFAVATIRAAVFSRRAAIALAVSSALVLVAMLGGMSTNNTQGPLMEAVLAIVLGSFGASWMALGTMALRRGPIRAIVPA